MKGFFPQAIRPQLAPLSVAEAVARNLLILVTDDNPTNCLVIVRQLRDERATAFDLFSTILHQLFR